MSFKNTVWHKKLDLIHTDGESDLGIRSVVSVSSTNQKRHEYEKENIPLNNHLIKYCKNFTLCLQSRCRKDLLQKIVQEKLPLPFYHSFALVL